VPDEEDEYLVGGLRAGREVGKRLLNVVPRRSGLDARRREVGLVAKVGDGVVGQPPALFRGVDDRRRPLVKLVRVLVVSADARDDEEMGVLGCRWPRGREDEEEGQRNRG
jgi:hypothetical protein